MKKSCVLIILSLLLSHCLANYTDTIRTNTNELSFSTKNGYDVVSFNNELYTNQIGAPQIPVKTIRLLIPIDQKVDSISIDSVYVQQIAGKYHIYPVQAAIPMNVSPSSVSFDDPDTAIYNDNTPYPAMRFEITDDGYPMGYHVITITFYPLEYIPSDSILNLYSEIYFTLHYSANNEDIFLPIMQSKFSNDLSKSYLKSIVSNYDEINTMMGGPLAIVNNGTPVASLKSMTLNPTLIDIPDYIIITCDSLKTEFQRLADWKTQKGIYTVVTTPVFRIATP